MVASTGTEVNETGVGYAYFHLSTCQQQVVHVLLDPTFDPGDC